MIVATWNPTQPSAHLPSGVRVGLSNQGGDWPNSVPEFYVDGRKATAREAAVRLRSVPVIDWVFNAGIPAGFDSSNVMAWRRVVADVRKALGGWRGLTKRQINAIFHLSDFENWTGYPAQNFSSQACDWFAWCLREAGFGGDYGNYATVPHGKPTLYPCAQTYAAGVNTQVLVGYMVAEPGKCYTAADVERCMEAANPRWSGRAPATPFWIVLSEYNDPESFADAVDCGANVLIWLDEAKRKADPQWAADQDKHIAGLLQAAGWRK